MTKVTSAQLQKQFGTYSELAQREPVTITNHGRDSLVLLSAETYRSMIAFLRPSSFLVEEATEEFIRALETAKAPEWTKIYNHEMDEE